MSNAGAETRGPVELSFTYTEDEYTSAARAFYARGTDPNFQFYLGLGVVAAALLLAWLAGDPYMGGSVVFAGLVVLAWRLYWRSALRRHFRRNPKFREAYRLTFTDEGLYFRAGEMESRLGWGFYTGVWETADFYYLVYGKDMFSLVPKRAFRGRRQEAAFRELLRSKLAHGAGGLTSPRSREAEPEYVPPAEPPDWR